MEGIDTYNEDITLLREQLPQLAADRIGQGLHSSRSGEWLVARGYQPERGDLEQKSETGGKRDCKIGTAPLLTQRLIHQAEWLFLEKQVGCLQLQPQILQRFRVPGGAQFLSSLHGSSSIFAIRRVFSDGSIWEVVYWLPLLRTPPRSWKNCL